MTQATKRLALDDVLVIDVDVHAHDTPEELAPYSDPQWRPVLENLGRAAHRYPDLPGYSFFAAPKLLGTGMPPPRGDSCIDIVWNAKQLVARPFGVMANFASIVTGGVLDRFPELKVVFTE